MDIKQVNKVLLVFSIEELESDLKNLDIIIQKIKKYVNSIEKNYALHYKTFSENQELKTKNESVILHSLLEKLIVMKKEVN